MISNFLAYFEKPHSYAKTALVTFWVTFEKIGQLFTLTSGDSGQNLFLFSSYILSTDHAAFSLNCTGKVKTLPTVPAMMAISCSCIVQTRVALK